MSLSDVFGGFLDKLLQLLPRSPFAAYLDAVEALPALRYLNWFLPLGEMVVVLEVWGDAVVHVYVDEYISLQN